MSQSREARERADRFFALHRGRRPLVLIHAWDAGSARVMEQAGAPAVAATGAGIAWSLGLSAGQRVPVVDFVGVCERICRAVRVPVSIELPDRLGADEGMLQGLVAAGVVGATVSEDSVAGLRALADRLDARLFLKARVGGARLDTVVERARRCVRAGADGIVASELGDADIVRLVGAVSAPVSFDVGDGWGPPIHALARAGVRRISLERGPWCAFVALLRRITEDAIAGRELPRLRANCHVS